ncbi:MAG: Asp-tRNA(Asn)/Glu-tRNA(Gln) amidotransferase subunit GatC [Clostridia bacterium]|nr:Asp-tRNA(Asn)/Glu-tRNA(Gln) amidotransferase subunit GatC [Clostridia bacterium]
MLKKEELLHIADLSKLYLNENECSLYQNDLDEIIEFASLVSDADVNNSNKPLTSISDLREDTQKNEFGKSEMISNALSKDGFIVIPKVVE